MISKHIHTAILSLFILAGCTNNAQQPAAKNDISVGGGCEDCEVMFKGMPETLSWNTTICGDDEPGERMQISGVVYEADGKTPAAGVILYVYHTDAEGIYSKQGDEQTIHGHLRGWMQTNQKGEYQFNSIRPASYPNTTGPQHIHPIIKEEGKKPYWIDEYLFEDDLSAKGITDEGGRGRGGSGIITLTQNMHGTWIGHRDIILGLNVEGYPGKR